MQDYKIDVLTLNKQQDVRSDCADITFYNTGTSIITLNNAVPIPAGSSISFSANRGEIDRTIYKINFSNFVTRVNLFVY
jgi:hypothetical protein